MRLRLGAIAVVAMFAMSIVPTSEAQLSNPNESTPTTLYFHIFDTFNKFPINTQEPDVTFFEVGGTNFPTIATPAGSYDMNTIYGYSTAGPVEYDFIENGRPRFHPERGISADVQLDQGTEPMAYIYLDVRDFTGLNAAPNYLPSFTVRATMRTGDDVGPDANLDAGELIMEGQQTAHVVDASVDGCEVDPTACPVSDDSANEYFAGQTGPDGHPVYVPDEEGIVEFAIPMEVAKTTIPKTDAYNIRIDWYQNPGDQAGEDEASEGYLRLVMDENHLPRLEMAIMNPVFIEFIHPQVAAGILLIHTGVNSPWGTYDVDVSNITLNVDGPSQPQALEQVVAQNAHVHGLHDQAAEITYLWEFRDEQAANGEYTISMEVPNLQGTNTATGQAGFVLEGKKAYGVADTGEEVEPVVGEGDDKDTPGVGLLVSLALLGAAVTLRRRRA